LGKIILSFLAGMTSYKFKDPILKIGKEAGKKVKQELNDYFMEDKNAPGSN